MPNILKHLGRLKAEPYLFPDASELEVELPEEETPEPEEVPERIPEREEAAAPIPETQTPVDYAQFQAEAIVQDAHRQAEAIIREAHSEAARAMEQARQDAERLAAEVLAAAKSEGAQEGYAQGLARGLEEGSQNLREQAVAQEVAVQQFLDKAADALDKQLDENVQELRDLALAVAEKVVCISLKSSSEIIGRIIQTAVDKRKRREWVHIYIAECDAKRMTSIPPALTTSLAALSERVRIIPMADEESGTCIIEMPNEIIDASASTQLNNLRALLSDTPSSGFDGDMF